MEIASAITRIYRYYYCYYYIFFVAVYLSDLTVVSQYGRYFRRELAVNFMTVPPGADDGFDLAVVFMHV